MQAFGLVAADLVEIHPVKFRLGRLQAQLMFARLCLRQIQRSGLKHPAALPGFRLQFPVKVHRIVLDAGNIGAVMQPVDIGRRVPGAARGQFIAFQQHHVAPAELGKMIQDRASDDAAADDNRLCMGPHLFPAPV